MAQRAAHLRLLPPITDQERTPVQPHASTRPWLPHAAAATVLALLSVLLFFRHVGELGLYSDDWYHLWAATQVPFHTLVQQWPFDFRPLDAGPWVIESHLFGAQLAWYYIVLFSIHCAAAGLLYVLVWRVTSQWLLALGCTALWLVYPADQALFWLTCIAYRTGTFFLLLGLVLLTGRRWPRARYAGALACCVLCLGSNELYLGLALALPLTAMIVAPGSLQRPRWRAGVPFLVLILAYAVYRIWYGPHVLYLPDNEAGGIRLDPPSVAFALLHGSVLTLLGAWQEALATLQAIGLSSYHPTSYEARTQFTQGRLPLYGSQTIVPYLVVLYLLAGTLAVLAWRRRERLAVTWQRIRPGALVLLLGLVGLLAGCSTFAATTSDPALNGIDSRLLAGAVFGGALTVTGCVWILTQWLPFPRRAAGAVFGAVMVLVIVTACSQSERTVATYARSWQMQRQFWHALLAAVPNVQPGTAIVVAPTDQAADDMLATFRSWGILTAASLVYPAGGVVGAYVLRQDRGSVCAGSRLGMVTFQKNGLQLPGSPVVPYAHILVVRYAASPATVATVVPDRLRPNGSSCSIPSHRNLISMSVARAATAELVQDL